MSVMDNKVSLYFQLILSVLFFVTISLGLTDTSYGISYKVKGEVALADLSRDIALLSVDSQGREIPHNPFSDGVLRKDCSPNKHLNTSISKPQLIINIEREISSLHDYNKIISDTRLKPKDIMPILHLPPPKS